MAKIYCIGTGLVTPVSMSERARVALEQCSFIFVAPDCASALLASRVGSGALCFPVADWFVYGKKRQEIYRAIAQEIVELYNRGATVGWLTKGHPGLICGVTSQLLNLCGDQVVIIAGESTIECCLSYCADLFSGGSFAVFNARDISSGNLSISPKLTSVILQTPWGDTNLCSAASRPKPAAFASIVKRLEEAFHPHHEIVLFTIVGGEAEPYVRKTLPLLELKGALASADVNVTIIVPAASAKVAPDTSRESPRCLQELFEAPARIAKTAP